MRGPRRKVVPTQDEAQNFLLHDSAVRFARHVVGLSRIDLDEAFADFLRAEAEAGRRLSIEQRQRAAREVGALLFPNHYVSDDPEAVIDRSPEA